MHLEWSKRTGEWVLTAYRDGKRQGYVLSPYPPFRWRYFDRKTKDWQRFKMEHATNIKEAKLCLEVVARMEQ